MVYKVLLWRVDEVLSSTNDVIAVDKLDSLGLLLVTMAMMIIVAACVELKRVEAQRSMVLFYD